MALLVHLTKPKPKHLTDAGRQHAERAEGMDMNPSQGLPQSLSERAKDSRAWHRVGTSYVAEWRMVYKELIVGFLVAGAVAALVPASFFQALFPGEGGPWWALPVQAALAPVLAVLTFIGSMGNGPMAAILASHGVVFGAIMAFLYADFVVPPAVKINANYYGWKFAGYLAAVFAAAAVIAGIAVHLLFAVVGLLPRGGRNVAEMATFAIDYTFWLNLLALARGRRPGCALPTQAGTGQGDSRARAGRHAGDRHRDRGMDRRARRVGRARVIVGSRPMGTELTSAFAALGDSTRWAILVRLGRGPMSASTLAEELPITRQAIARHLDVLRAGLVDAELHGRQVRFRAVGSRLSALARDVEAIARGWERRLAHIKEVAESSSERAGAPE